MAHNKFVKEENDPSFAQIIVKQFQLVISIISHLTSGWIIYSLLPVILNTPAFSICSLTTHTKEILVYKYKIWKNTAGFEKNFFWLLLFLNGIVPVSYCKNTVKKWGISHQMSKWMGSQASFLSFWICNVFGTSF